MTGAKCEDCGKPQMRYFVSHRRVRDCWKIVCADCAEKWDYPIEIYRFFRSKSETVDWLAHLSEKAWFDANAFCRMMHRYRAAIGAFGKIH